MSNKDNLLGVLTTIFKWKKQILYICLATAIGTLLIAFAFLDDYYISTTSFYAASPDLAKPAAIGPIDRELDYYGEDEDVDRILAIAESNDIADYLINKYNLYEHYDIDPNHKKGPVKVKKAFAKLYNVAKTKYNSIEVSVEDKSPELAAKMVNDARLKINDDVQKLIKESQDAQMKSLAKNIEAKEKDIEIINDSLEVLRTRYGIIDVSTQGRVYATSMSDAEGNLAKSKARLGLLQQSSSPELRDTIMLLKADVQGYQSEIDHLNEKLKSLNKGMEKIRLLNELHGKARIQLGFDIERYKQLESAYNAEFSAIHLLEDGGIPIAKSRPKRSIILIAAVFIAFIFSILGVLVFDAYKDVNWKAVFNAQ